MKLRTGKRPMKNSARCENMKCFACNGAKCQILTEAITEKPCPFAKTDQDLRKGREKAFDRLKAIRREDLIAAYTANVRGYQL